MTRIGYGGTCPCCDESITIDELLGNENPQLWEAVRNTFVGHWKPVDEMEAMLVDELAATHWKLLRAESIETATLNFEMDVLSEEVEKTFKRIDEPTRQRLEQLRLAAEARHVVRLRYLDLKGGRSERRLRPLGSFYWGAVWTLAAWCETRHDFRSFRVDRIEALSVLPERFRDEPGSTLADLFRQVGMTPTP